MVIGQANAVGPTSIEDSFSSFHVLALSMHIRGLRIVIFCHDVDCMSIFIFHSHTRSIPFGRIKCNISVSSSEDFWIFCGKYSAV